LVKLVYGTLVLFKEFLSKKLSSVPQFERPAADLYKVEMGYVETGLTWYERQKVWLRVDDNVIRMYEQHDKKKSIMLWCYAYDCDQKAQNKVDPASKSGTHLVKILGNMNNINRFGQ
jgi:hypothetical protein